MRLFISLIVALVLFSACQEKIEKETISTKPLKDGNISAVTLFQITARKVADMLPAGSDFLTLLYYASQKGGCKKGYLSLIMQKKYIKIKLHKCTLYDGKNNGTYDGIFVFRGDSKNFEANYYDFSVNKKELKQKIYFQSYKLKFSKEGKIQDYYISSAKYFYKNNFSLTISKLHWKKIDGELKAYGNVQGAIKMQGSGY